jgi:GNAT superfamily N-acetyltransferase
MAFKLRKLDEAKGDLDFVVKYWLDSYRAVGWLGQNVRARFYGKYHKQLIEQAIKDCQTVVLEDEKVSGLLIGFINYAPESMINYYYIKKDFRGKGLEEELIKLAIGKATEIFFTHEINYLKNIDVNYNFNPYPFLTGNFKQ